MIVQTESLAVSSPSVVLMASGLPSEQHPADNECAEDALAPDDLGTYGPEGVARCPHCEQMARFVLVDDCLRQAFGICSRCGADWRI